LKRVTASTNYLPSPEALKTAIGSLPAADVVLLAAHALQVGNKSYALALCEAHADAQSPALRVLQAIALCGLGQVPRALELIDSVLAENGGHPPALFYGAQMALETRQDARATQLLLALLDRFPDFPSAQGMLATACFPGPPYRELLQRLHEILQPRTYLEIGVETGATLGFAKAAQRAVGIDPDASKLQRDSLPACARVFSVPSDDFFAQHTREEIFGDQPIDLALIDGMHLFEYALRDFINVEAWSQPHGVIVLHDCVPLFPLTASRRRQSNLWVGDVWKVVSILREYRPELSVKIVMTAPSGLCVVRGLNPASQLLRERLDEIVARYQDLPYPGRGLDVPPGFELVPPNAAGLRKALQPH
jgi:predicted O-methyltransferase YrrM